MKFRIENLSLVAVLMLSGCKPPPVSPLLTQACATAPEREVVRTQSAAILDLDRFYAIDGGAYGAGPGGGRLPRYREGEQLPCPLCVELLLDKGYAAVEYRLSLPGGFWAPDEAMVGFHSLASQGNPACAWSARLSAKQKAWLAERVPAGRCVTMETGPRRGTVSIVQDGGVHAAGPAYIWRDIVGAVDRTTGRPIARATGYHQTRGDFSALHCEGRHSNAAARLHLNLVLESVPAATN